MKQTTYRTSYTVMEVVTTTATWKRRMRTEGRKKRKNGPNLRTLGIKPVKQTVLD
jgi:hypothetical protein